jgi:hypothetical protein
MFHWKGQSAVVEWNRRCQTYCSNLSNVGIVHNSPENCTTRDEKVSRDEWEGWNHVALPKTRRGGDGGIEDPLSIRYTVLGNVGVVKERGTQG